MDGVLTTNAALDSLDELSPQPINIATAAARGFYSLVAHSMKRDINLSLRTRLGFGVFFYGVSIEAAEHHRVGEMAGDVFLGALADVEDADHGARKFLRFCQSSLEENSPWGPVLAKGRKAYLNWVNGSEVRALELVREMLMQAPHPDFRLAPRKSLVRKALSVLR
jgi:hypothetical protein